MDLTGILSNMPRMKRLYSPALGNVYFEKIDSYAVVFPIIVQNRYGQYRLTSQGHLVAEDGECMIFPHREHRTWHNWQSVLMEPGEYINYEGNILRLSGIKATTHYDKNTCYGIDSHDNKTKIKRPWEAIYATRVEIGHYLLEGKEKGTLADNKQGSEGYAKFTLPAHSMKSFSLSAQILKRECLISGELLLAKQTGN